MCETLNPCEEQCVDTVEELQKPHIAWKWGLTDQHLGDQKCRQRERGGPSSLTISDMRTGHSYSSDLSYSLADAHSVYRHKDDVSIVQPWEMDLCCVDTMLLLNICEVGVLGSENEKWHVILLCAKCYKPDTLEEAKK